MPDNVVEEPWLASLYSGGVSNRIRTGPRSGQRTAMTFDRDGRAIEEEDLVFREGMSAESMVESYPALTLEAVHGALAFYLANENEIDAYLAEGERIAESQHAQSREVNSDLIAKLRRARHENQIPG